MNGMKLGFKRMTLHPKVPLNSAFVIVPLEGDNVKIKRL
jgi:hypothetical protein